MRPPAVPDQLIPLVARNAFCRLLEACAGRISRPNGSARPARHGPILLLVDVGPPNPRLLSAYWSRGVVDWQFRAHH
jgi:hypothetical protein